MVALSRIFILLLIKSSSFSFHFTHMSIAVHMSKVNILPASTWNTYSILNNPMRHSLRFNNQQSPLLNPPEMILAQSINDTRPRTYHCYVHWLWIWPTVITSIFFFVFIAVETTLGHTLTNRSFSLCVPQRNMNFENFNRSMHTMKTDVAFSFSHTLSERKTADFPLITTQFITKRLDRRVQPLAVGMYIKTILV